MPRLPVGAQLLLVFAVAAAGALALVPLSARVGAAVGLIDLPRPGEVQRRPVGRAGGYGIVAAFFLALAVSIPIADRFWWEFGWLAGLTLGAALLVPFAAWDDARRLGPLPQLVAQVACAAVPIAFGIRMTQISNPFGATLDLKPWLVVPVTLLWIVGMINTLNWIDTMDGLAGGVALIGALVLCGKSLLQEGPDGDLRPQYTIAMLLLALAGARVGF